jgi:hypothetical protein
VARPAHGPPNADARETGNQTGINRHITKSINWKGETEKCREDEDYRRKDPVGGRQLLLYQRKNQPVYQRQRCQQEEILKNLMEEIKKPCKHML